MTIILLGRCACELQNPTARLHDIRAGATRQNCEELSSSAPRVRTPHPAPKTRIKNGDPKDTTYRVAQRACSPRRGLREAAIRPARRAPPGRLVNEWERAAHGPTRGTRDGETPPPHRRLRGAPAPSAPPHLASALSRLRPPHIPNHTNAPRTGCGTM